MAICMNLFSTVPNHGIRCQASKPLFDFYSTRSIIMMYGKDREPDVISDRIGSDLIGPDLIRNLRNLRNLRIRTKENGQKRYEKNTDCC